MTVLVTGGSGYIGSHVVRSLRESGGRVVVVDDLVTGFVDRVPVEVPFLKLDISDETASSPLAAFMREHGVTTVMHFAARKQVAESMERPLWYSQQNIGGLHVLLTAADRVGVDRFVFSSSAAVYGEPDGAMITEATPANPVNPYGRTKLVGEWLVRDWAAATGARTVSLRYFNVAGAGAAELADRRSLNLIPMVFDRLEAGESPMIFGDDYATPDGTCVRDFVHVSDVSDAHLAAVGYLDDMKPSTAEVFNLGTGRGTSVREIIDLAVEVSGIDLPPRVEPRRAGDPASVVADAGLVAARVGWQARHDVRDMVQSAWRSRRALADRRSE